MRNKTTLVFVFTAFLLATYTQFAHLTAVPGFHFDEAWQANFAYRILAEKGFHPLSAMNSYTSPVVHYLLAGVFKIFAPTLPVLRASYAFVNLTTLALLAALLWRMGEKLAVAWFILFWALLPASVHDHRFYVELTGFHGLCFAAAAWGIALWRARPRASFALVLVATLLATYSHILFIAVFAGGAVVLAPRFAREFTSQRARLLIAAVALLLLPLPIRMAIGLHKFLPVGLAAALVTIAHAAAPFAKKPRPWWQSLPKLVPRILPWLNWLAIPFLIAFVLLIWNGFWPYAQATGHLQLWWLPVNAVLFVTLAVRKKEREDLFWQSFIACFLLSSVLILKQSPRYYMIPIILGMLWLARATARIKARKIQVVVAAVFMTWNLWAFQANYLEAFERAGPTTAEMRVGIFHDNARDFRPFQLVFAWLVQNNCQLDLRWVEDDRFGNPIDFLRLSAPPPHGKCPWNGPDLFLSHIPNYDPNFKGTRRDANTPPAYPNVKYLAHFPEWGDLAVWIRR